MKSHGKKPTSVMLVQNLNRNAMLEYISDVETGLHQPDKKYKKFKSIEPHLQTIEKFIDYQNAKTTVKKQ